MNIYPLNSKIYWELKMNFCYANNSNVLLMIQKLMTPNHKNLNNFKISYEERLFLIYFYGSFHLDLILYFEHS